MCHTIGWPPNFAQQFFPVFYYFELLIWFLGLPVIKPLQDTLYAKPTFCSTLNFLLIKLVSFTWWFFFSTNFELFNLAENRETYLIKKLSSSKSFPPCGRATLCRPVAKKWPTLIQIWETFLLRDQTLEKFLKKNLKKIIVGFLEFFFFATSGLYENPSVTCGLDDIVTLFKLLHPFMRGSAVTLNNC